MLDTNLQTYWANGGTDDELVSEIIGGALDEPPQSLKKLARVLQIADRSPLPPEIQQRIDDELGSRAHEMRSRFRQVDQLGNPETDPGAIVEILGEEAEDLNWGTLDRERLRSCRRTAGDRIRGVAALLTEVGWETLPAHAQVGLQRALIELESEQKYSAQALLEGPGGSGFVLGLKFVKTEDGDVKSDESIDDVMAGHARQAIHVAFGDSFGGRFSLEWKLRFEGASIGLAMVAAGFVAQHLVEIDPLTAATGTVELDGAIQPVSGIAGKLEAAAASGIQRVLLPRANQSEAEETRAASGLELLFASEVSEVRRLLSRVPNGTQLTAQSKRRLVRGAAPEFGLDLVDEKEIPHGFQFKLSSLGGSGSLALYDSGKAVAGGSGAAKGRVQDLIDRWLLLPQPEPRSPSTVTVENVKRRDAIRKGLLALGADEVETNSHEAWRIKLKRGLSAATTVQYSSGKLVLQGNAPAWDEARQVLYAELGDLAGSEVLNETPALELVRARRAANAGEPWIGTDESGKGDYFGPLVSAAAFVTPEQAEALKGLGVVDSKKLSDTRVHALAPEIRQLLGNGVEVTAINPPRFNSLYREMRARGQSLNTMLAWGHSRSIENLIKRQLRPGYAIVDQFADVRFINNEILSETRRTELEILQFPKAELDVAVAAASIAAREAFLNWLARTSAELGLQLPKGAGEPVINAGKELVAKLGPEKLGDFAKLSFKTTQAVLDDAG
jgi:ribonuclease HIII